jgi:hypothetical protein
MRLRANKLLYLPIGGALAAGLLTSAILVPQATLAASQDCYGVCSSVTTLALSSPTVSASRESSERFSVTVTAGPSGSLVASKRGGGHNKGTGTPTGKVSVKSGSKTLCRIHLSHGRGQCSLGNHELSPGSYQIVAQYGGDRNFSPSTSGRERLIVTGGTSSKTSLSLSRSTLSRNRQWIEEFGVRVTGRPRGAGTPTGWVTVETGSKVLCRAHLRHGRGECSLSGPLRPGSYQVVAQYSGDGHFSPSTSGEKHLTVRRH